MKTCLKMTLKLIMKFKEVKVEQVLRTRNSEVDNLAKMVSLGTA